jgi:tripartite-type tricarboxylate transporter receptor subunit TctC
MMNTTQRNAAAGKLIAGAIVASTAQPFGPAYSQDAIAQFYKGKTVTIAVGAAAGGGLDTYARLVGRHLGKHIPGNPNVVVSNMPGAGGQIAARHNFAIAPKDGTHMATFFPSVLIDPLLIEAARTIDPSKFNYVGNAKEEISVCMLRKDAPVAKLQDLQKTEIVLGGTTAGSQVVDFPTAAKELLGAKYKIISGYKGTRDVGLAIEKGEVQGICGIGWSTLKVQYPDLLTDKSFARIFVQEDFKGDPELNKAGVPLMPELAKDEETREVLKLLYAQNELARPYVVPPEVPADRVDALRKAFLATTADPELQAEAAKMRVDVEGTSGPDMQKLVAELYRSPKPVLDRLSKALGR